MTEFILAMIFHSYVVIEGQRPSEASGFDNYYMGLFLLSCLLVLITGVNLLDEWLRNFPMVQDFLDGWGR
jgi:hypothetical protein